MVAAVGHWCAFGLGGFVGSSAGHSLEVKMTDPDVEGFDFDGCFKHFGKGFAGGKGVVSLRKEAGGLKVVVDLSGLLVVKETLLVVTFVKELVKLRVFGCR